RRRLDPQPAVRPGPHGLRVRDLRRARPAPARPGPGRAAPGRGLQHRGHRRARAAPRLPELARGGHPAREPRRAGERGPPPMSEGAASYPRDLVVDLEAVLGALRRRGELATADVALESARALGRARAALNVLA